MSAFLRIASAQFELRAERSLEEFAAHVDAVAASAAAAGAELLVLPELVTTGLLGTRADADTLSVAELTEAYRSTFPTFTDGFVDTVREVARARNLSICGGSHYRRAADGSFRNTAYLAAPDGSLLAQDKLHLTPQERDMATTPGDEVAITTVGPFTVAVQICADIEFPEVSRYLAGQGVTLILVPSLTWNRRGAQRVRYGAHARAMENQIYVAVSTLVGSSGIPHDGALQGSGYATVTMPLDRVFGANDGVLAAHQDTRQEGIVVADLDPGLLTAARQAPEPPGLQYIRPDLYERLDGVRVP